MKAIAVEEFGTKPGRMTLPAPEPGPGEIQVKMAAASVNPLDWTAADGLFEGSHAHRFPLVLGFDGAGTVTAVGRNVRRWSVGDRVFGQFWSDPIGHGSWAEVTVAPQDGGSGALAPVPEGLSMVRAAALPTAAMAALGAVDTVGCDQDDTLLIIGATGGVGTFATQLAASRGIHVIATASGEAAVARMRALGAQATIDHRAAPVDQALTARWPAGVDGLLDLVGDPTAVRATARHLKDGRNLVSIAFGVRDELYADHRITATNYLLERKQERLTEIGRLAAAGQITVVIDREVPFDEAPEALTGTPAGDVRGKTVIRF